MKTNKAIRFVALFTIGTCIGGVAMAATELAGIVQELGQPPGKNGVSGVLIQVKDKDGAVLATGATNGAGQYRIPLQAGVVAKSMEFKKIKFRALPTIRTVTDPKKEQRPVLMIREGQPDGYYAGVWQEFSNLDRYDKAAALSAIDSLDTPEQVRMYALRNRQFLDRVEFREERAELAAASAQSETDTEKRRIERYQLAAARDSEGRLRLVPPSDSAESNAANSSEAEALQYRVRELEVRLSESRRLLELRNAELADLQARLASSPHMAAQSGQIRPEGEEEEAPAAEAAGPE